MTGRLNHVENKGLYNQLDRMSDREKETSPWSQILGYNNVGLTIHIIDDFTSGQFLAKSGVVSDGLAYINERSNTTNFGIYFFVQESAVDLPYIIYGLKNQMAYKVFGHIAIAYSEYERIQHGLSINACISECYEEIIVDPSIIDPNFMESLSLAHRLVDKIATYYNG